MRRITQALATKPSGAMRGPWGPRHSEYYGSYSEPRLATIIRSTIPRGSPMPDKRSSQTTFEPDGTPRGLHLTVDQMRAISGPRRRGWRPYAPIGTQRLRPRLATALCSAGQPTTGGVLRDAGASAGRFGARCRQLRSPSAIRPSFRLARRRRPDAAPTGEAA